MHIVFLYKCIYTYGLLVTYSQLYLVKILIHSYTCTVTTAYDKHSRGKTFVVHQQYSLCRENICSQYTNNYYKAGKFALVKHLCLAKIYKNTKDFLFKCFIIIIYMVACKSSLLNSNGYSVHVSSLYVYIATLLHNQTDI